MATLIDSYTNYQGASSLGFGYKGMGQCFTGATRALDSCKWYIRKANSPTGNAYAKVYAITGTFGTDAKPVGAALATSDALDVSTLSTSISYVTFNFSGANRIALSAGTNYVLTLEYSSVPTDTDVINYGERWTSPAHAGNECHLNSGTWTGTNATDLNFYVYGEDTVVNTMSCTPATFDYTPQTDGNNVVRKMICTPASYVFTGLTAGTKKIWKMVCTPASYVFMGMTAVLSKIAAPLTYLMVCTPTVFTVVGKSVTGWYSSLFSSLTQDTKSSSTLTQDDKH